MVAFEKICSSQIGLSLSESCRFSILSLMFNRPFLSRELQVDRRARLVSFFVIGSPRGPGRPREGLEGLGKSL